MVTLNGLGVHLILAAYKRKFSLYSIVILYTFSLSVWGMGRVGLTQTIFGWGTQPSQVLWVGYPEKCWVPGVTRGFSRVIQKRDFINQIRTRYTEISDASGISPTSVLTRYPSYTLWPYP